MIIHLIWIMALISFIYFLIKTYKEYNSLDFSDYFVSFMISFGIALITLLLILSTSKVIDNNSNKELIITDSKEIYALNDSTSINGQSFLSSGYVKEELVYRMYVKENGGKKVKEIKSSTATIYEEDEKLDRYIETYKYQYTNNFIKWLIGESTWDNPIYKIYIPKGSITTEYKLDLK